MKLHSKEGTLEGGHIAWNRLRAGDRAKLCLVTIYGEGGGVGIITGGGGGGGACGKFYPYEKGGGKSFSHAEGGAQQVLGYFLRGSLKF